MAALLYVYMLLCYYYHLRWVALVKRTYYFPICFSFVTLLAFELASGIGLCLQPDFVEMELYKRMIHVLNTILFI